MGQYGEAADGLRGIGVQTPCARVMPAVSDVVGEGVLFPETSCRHTGCTICMEEVYAHVHDAGPAVSRSVHGGERGAEVASGVESASAQVTNQASVPCCWKQHRSYSELPGPFTMRLRVSRP